MARSRRNRTEEEMLVPASDETVPSELLESTEPKDEAPAPEPELEAKPAPAPAPASSSSKITNRPLRRRRGVSSGQVPLRTFLQAVKVKNDQLAGFNLWAQKKGHTKHTMKDWRALLEEFQKAPVAKN